MDGDASFHVQSSSGPVNPGSEAQDLGERAGQVIGRHVSGPLRAPADETVGPDQHGAAGTDPAERPHPAGPAPRLAGAAWCPAPPTRSASIGTCRGAAACSAAARQAAPSDPVSNTKPP